MSYGTPADVAGLSRVWTLNGLFIDPVEDYDIRGTNPTLTTVQEWLTNVSAQMDVALGSEWFVTPLDPDASPTAYAAIKQYVVGLVADMVHVANGVEREVSPLGKIMQDMTRWVKMNADGLLGKAVKQAPTPSVKTQASIRVIGTL